jgi:hypothetical protein
VPSKFLQAQEVESDNQEDSAQRSENEKILGKFP